jgi:hypothetical protein
MTQMTMPRQFSRCLRTDLSVRPSFRAFDEGHSATTF